MAELKKQKVLFLCTGNSSRSQLAEAIVNNSFGDKWIAYSAGTKPAGYVHPMAIQALAEIDIEHGGYSKNVEDFHDAEFDLVVTVCDFAAEDCPVWLGSEKRVHHSFPDPAKVSGSDEQIMDAFRSVRDDILYKIPKLLSGYRFNNQGS